MFFQNLNWREQLQQIAQEI